MKDCGSCVYFFKWRNDKFGGGLCDFLDARTKTDHGSSCPHWKGKKYKRPRKLRVTEIEKEDA